MRKQIIQLAAVWALALLAMLLFVVPALAVGGPGDPEPGTVAGITSYSADSRIVTGSITTVNSASRRTNVWHSADVFLVVDVGANAAVTVTPQLSWNNSDWVNAQFSYVVPTTTAPINESIYRFIVTADGNDYIRLLLAGEYLRFSITYTGPVTSTIGVTLRND